jgi:hypothetical protein
MFPIGKSKLSLREIANYWAREIQPPASWSELLELLDAAWWLGEIRGDSVKSCLDLLKHMFKAMHDRDDAGVVFFVEEAPNPKWSNCPMVLSWSIIDTPYRCHRKT